MAVGRLEGNIFITNTNTNDKYTYKYKWQMQIEAMGYHFDLSSPLYFQMVNMVGQWTPQAETSSWVIHYFDDYISYICLFITDGRFTTDTMAVDGAKISQDLV